MEEGEPTTDVISKSSLPLTNTDEKENIDYSTNSATAKEVEPTTSQSKKARRRSASVGLLENLLDDELKKTVMAEKAQSPPPRVRRSAATVADLRRRSVAIVTKPVREQKRNAYKPIEIDVGDQKVSLNPILKKSSTVKSAQKIAKKYRHTSADSMSRTPRPRVFRFNDTCSIRVITPRPGYDPDHMRINDSDDEEESTSRIRISTVPLNITPNSQANLSSIKNLADVPVVQFNAAMIWGDENDTTSLEDSEKSNRKKRRKSVSNYKGQLSDEDTGEILRSAGDELQEEPVEVAKEKKKGPGRRRSVLIEKEDPSEEIKPSKAARKNRRRSEIFVDPVIPVVPSPVETESSNSESKLSSSSKPRKSMAPAKLAFEKDVKNESESNSESKPKSSRRKSSIFVPPSVAVSPVVPAEDRRKCRRSVRLLRSAPVEDDVEDELDKVEKTEEGLLTTASPPPKKNKEESKEIKKSSSSSSSSDKTRKNKGRKSMGPNGIKNFFKAVDSPVSKKVASPIPVVDLVAGDNVPSEATATSALDVTLPTILDSSSTLSSQSTASPIVKQLAPIFMKPASAKKIKPVAAEPVKFAPLFIPVSKPKKEIEVVEIEDSESLDKTESQHDSSKTQRRAFQFKEERRGSTRHFMIHKHLKNENNEDETSEIMFGTNVIGAAPMVCSDVLGDYSFRRLTDVDNNYEEETNKHEVAQINEDFTLNIDSDDKRWMKYVSHLRTNDGVPTMITEASAPFQSNQVLALSAEEKDDVKTWLQKWKKKVARNRANEAKNNVVAKVPKSKKRYSSDDEDYNEEDSSTLPNPLILRGPVGVGKTSLAQALAKEMHMDVIEMAPNDDRSEHLIRKKMEGSSTTHNVQTKPSALFFSPRSNAPKSVTNDFTQSLFVFEHVDVLFEDIDFAASVALLSVVHNSLVPVIWTCEKWWPTEKQGTIEDFEGKKKVTNMKVVYMENQVERVRSHVQKYIQSVFNISIDNETIAKMSISVHDDLRALLLLASFFILRPELPMPLHDRGQASSGFDKPWTGENMQFFAQNEEEMEESKETRIELMMRNIKMYDEIPEKCRRRQTKSKMAYEEIYEAMQGRFGRSALWMDVAPILQSINEAEKRRKLASGRRYLHRLLDAQFGYDGDKLVKNLNKLRSLYQF